MDPRKRCALAANLLVALLLSLGAPGAQAKDPRLGRWDSKGRYTPSPLRERYRHLHSLRDGELPRYPIVLVHGLFGFDTLRFGPFFLKYFVGVAEHLREQGMQVLVTETTPFASFEERATQLKEQIDAVGWEKFNIISHSAGGLDSRYAISRLGMADRVASLTTVSSPHHGVWYADFALKWVFEKQRMWKVWDFFRLKRQGIHDISIKGMREFNELTPDAPGVRYFSFGGQQPFYKVIPPLSTALVVNSIMEKSAAKKKLSLKERLMARVLLPKEVRKALKRAPEATIRDLIGGDHPWLNPILAGANDGLVSLSSARWGDYQADLAYDHLDEMGWFTTFDVKRFYRNITRMLADAGY
jgi:pimeloyl-ACP methyl ester carboxylesterase